MGDRETGKVKFFDANKGFGFIERDGDKDLFVHISDVDAGELHEGRQVEFGIGKGRKGPKAVKVKVVGTSKSRESGAKRRSKPRRNSPTRSGSQGPPLYATDDRPQQRLAGAHSGLWYDKFCDTWNAGFRGFPDEGKRDWISQFDGVSVGDAERLASATQRQRKLVAARRGNAVELETRSRFVTGLGREHPVENGFAWHPTLGTPFLPGSGVKGVVRAWAEQWEDEVDAEDDQAKRIFGEQDQVGSVIFLDAVPTAPTRLEADVMTPHYGPWYQQGPPEVPADWHSPTPIPFLTVAAGTTFQFGVLPRRLDHDQARDDVDVVVGWLQSALNWIGAGAKTAVGYGRFKSE